MLPRLVDGDAPAPLYAALLAELGLRGFAGDLSSGAADRTVAATDNSIYQVPPGAIAFPRRTEDLVRIARVMGDPRFAEAVLAPRGGGTGTNGQSLAEGLVVDVSRHMNRILEIDPEQGWARVEAGVVKDQLNAALAPHRLFFPPELSTSNRATIGGMISTDACGQGSCLYGKTRDYVLELTSVLMDGTAWTSRPLSDDELAEVTRRRDRIGAVHRIVDAIQRDEGALIESRFPKLNRSLTGYDLAHIRDREGRFDLNAVLCGSEGTLAILAEAKLRVLPIPKHAALVTVRYDGFDAALRDAPTLVGLGAASIETVDSQVLALARRDIVWDGVRPFFPDDNGRMAAGVNIVEFVGGSAEAVEASLDRLAEALADGAAGRRGFVPVRDPRDIAAVWDMRKRAVGLLGAMPGEARPIPFVEDTAVPPEHLADYVAEFRAILDARGLAYGMFGHVDAGVLHVRPAIDMKDPTQEVLIREVTEEVVRLTRRYGGLLWGEHGKGMRSEFSPEVFGPLYPALQAIKAAFDPDNRLNPGKVAAPAGQDLRRIDGVPTRGQRDRTVPPAVRAAFGDALHCNGNGACFSWNADEAMCPSYKATRDRRHSPKGRAALVREWLRQLAAAGHDPVAEATALRRGAGWRTFATRARNSWARWRGEPDFSHAVKEAMDGCLACKSCAGQCPVKVDVPSVRARFLEAYHGRYLRPPRDHVVGVLETVLPLLARAPRLANAVLRSAGPALRGLGLVALPALSRLDLDRALATRGVRTATPAALAALGPADRMRAVVLVPDAFTRFYDAPLIVDVVDLLRQLGFAPWMAPFRPNGKPLHVHGFLGRFGRVAARAAEGLRALEATGIALVGIDPAMTLAYRDEYVGALGVDAAPRVQLLQEWLAGRLQDRGAAPRLSGRFTLLPHCTERTIAPGSLRDWQAVFLRLGAELSIAPAGCCGMAGTYGHEAEHRATSERIYASSWAKRVAEHPDTGTLLADGYSCRSQVAAIEGIRLRHPVQALLEALRQATGQATRADPVDAPAVMAPLPRAPGQPHRA